MNGGWRGWLEAGLPLCEKEVTPVASNSLDLKAKRSNILTKPTQIFREFVDVAVQNQKYVYVDTRRPDAYNSYHIDEAKNIPARLLMEDSKFSSFVFFFLLCIYLFLHPSFFCCYFVAIF